MNDPNDVIDRDVLVSHMDGVRRLARSLVRDDTAADDVVQEAMVAALENKRPVRHGAGAWLAGVVRNVVRRDYRSASRRHAREKAAAKPEATPSAAESVVRAAEQSRILDLVVHLAEPYRTAIVLRYVEDLPPRTIADRIGLPVETVRTQVRRGLEQLRGELDRRHGGRTRWMGVLAVVASGPSLTHATPKAGTASGLKVALSIAAVAAVGFTAWWSWGLAFPDTEPAQHAFDIDTGKALVADAPDRPPLPLKPLTANPPADPPTRGVGTEPPPPLIVESEVDTPANEDGTVSSGAAPTPRLQPTATNKPTLERVEPDRLRGRPLGSLLTDATGGLIEIPKGNAWIGTPHRWVEGRTLARRNGEVPEAFAMEAPRHLVEVGAFSIDRYEVSNAQYHRFLLASSHVEYVVERGETLDSVARKLVRHDVPRNIDWDHTAYQLYRANFATLHAQDPSLVQIDADTKLPDLEKSFAAFRKRALRRRTMLSFFDRAPPGHWPSDRYEDGTGGHPVRFVSQREAAAFANWAGKHLPTEIEWEYASRGPDGWAYPWGSSVTGFEASVNGGRARAKGVLPMTVNVDRLEDGKSFFGLYNTLGNVSEWTSSVLSAYPKSGASHSREGRAVVFRGGSAADEDDLVVRPAFRGWPLGSAAPFPNERRPWTGFRCALYAEPGRSRLPDLEAVTAAARTLPLGALDFESYAGAEAKSLVQPGAAVENGIFVMNQAYAVLGVTLNELALSVSRPTRFGFSPTHTLRQADELLALSEIPKPVVFGMIYTDVPLTELYGSTGAVFHPPEKLKRREAPPGAYIVGLYHSRLVLFTPAADDVYYVTSKPVPKSIFNVVKRSRPRREAGGNVAFELRERADAMRFEMTVPLGGGTAAGHVVLVRFELKTVRNGLRDVQKFARWVFHPR